MDPSVVREAREVLARAVQCYEAATSSAEAETALLSELKRRAFEIYFQRWQA